MSIVADAQALLAYREALKPSARVEPSKDPLERCVELLTITATRIAALEDRIAELEAEVTRRDRRVYEPNDGSELDPLSMR